MSGKTLKLTVLVILALMPLYPSLHAQSVPVLSVTFEGNSEIDSARLRSQLRSLRVGGWYHPEGIKAELRSLELLYDEEGFIKARVGPPRVELQAVPGKGQAAAIHIPIVEGPRYILGKLSVRNAEAFKPETFLRLAPLRAGQPYSRTKMASWQEKIEEAYSSMGYIRIQTRVVEEVHEFGKTVDSVMECKEGSSYRVGKIAVVSNDPVNQAEFKKQILVGEGSLYNPEMLIYSLHLLNSMRIYRPLSQSDVEIHIDDSRATVDIVFRVSLLAKTSSSSDSG